MGLTETVYPRVVWFFVDEPWQYRVLDHLPAGVDRSQLEQTRKLTPTERLDAVVQLMELGEAVHQAIFKKTMPP